MRHLNTLLALAALPLAAFSQSTISVASSQAWSANAGWIDFRPERPTAGDGVRVGDTILSGYLWSANTGWINFGDGSPTNSLRYSNTGGGDFGVNHDGAGNLTGLAWSANSGWINFGWAAPDDINRPRLNLSDGRFEGYAWSPNLGWINLGTGMLRTEVISIADSDGDGISDTWELAHAPTLKNLSAAGDADGDGISDKQEYLLDTDPMVPSTPLRITRLSKIPNVNAVELEWPSSPARVYGIEAKPDLSETNWLLLGTITGSAGTNTVQAVEMGAPTAFFRLHVKLPLRP